MLFAGGLRFRPVLSWRADDSSQLLAHAAHFQFCSEGGLPGGRRDKLRQRENEDYWIDMDILL